MQQLARRQRLLITTFQLQNLGYTKSTIHDRVAAGRLHPTPFTVVYTLAPPRLGRLETIKAAALASGPDDCQATGRLPRRSGSPSHRCCPCT